MGSVPMTACTAARSPQLSNSNSSILGCPQACSSRTHSRARLENSPAQHYGQMQPLALLEQLRAVEID
ncbi:hypothetical protein BpHYR1_030869 [Brachionus plicatilis]|uniref:Uncharacterized protein n=1 Tax=Brachionus plicatilis TaxID=10195 RepID=A0A3M7PXF1_BRAPC|nr:hypothetical protein BpHYR1_030869 [Brachionus plicatilis]